MGYPMTYKRVVARNRLYGGYEDSATAGDLRRLETDQRDDEHLRMYAALAGVTPEQVKVIFDVFFEGVSAEQVKMLDTFFAEKS